MGRTCGRPTAFLREVAGSGGCVDSGCDGRTFWARVDVCTQSLAFCLSIHQPLADPRAPAMEILQHPRIKGHCAPFPRIPRADGAWSLQPAWAVPLSPLSPPSSFFPNNSSRACQEQESAQLEAPGSAGA